MQGYFNNIVKAQNDADRAQAFADWHNDMAGRETGRMTRTVFNGISGFDASRRDRGKDEILDLVVNSAANYAVRYNDLMDGLKDTRSRAVDLSNRIDRLLDNAQKRYQDGLDKAVTWDGKKVFLDTETGIAYTEDMEALPEEVTAGIEFAGKTTLQDHQKNKELLNKAEDLDSRSDQTLFNIDGMIGNLKDHEDGGLDGDGFKSIKDGKTKADQEITDIEAETKALENTMSAPSMVNTTTALVASTPDIDL